MARWKARGRLPISANWTFSLALAVEALWANIGRNCAVWKGGTHFERKFQGEKWSSTNEFWRKKTRFPGLSFGVVCVILRLAVLIQYRRVTHTHTHTQTISLTASAFIRPVFTTRISVADPVFWDTAAIVFTPELVFTAYYTAITQLHSINKHRTMVRFSWPTDSVSKFGCVPDSCIIIIQI